MATMSLLRPQAARLTEAHTRYLRVRIHHYRQKAAHAFSLAHQARERQDERLARGLFDEAQAFLAMAEGLQDQQITQEIGS